MITWRFSADLEGWQPIETAPEGERLLLVGVWWLDGTEGRYQHILLGSMRRQKNEKARWNLEASPAKYYKLTHWMPLPEPPQLDGGAKE